MKFLRLSTALSAALLAFIAGFHASADVPEPDDYVCFMTTQSGQVVDLSKLLCGQKKSAPTDSANSDQAFIEDYKRNLMEYPDVRDNLLASAEKTPKLSIIQAKNVCNSLKAGLSLGDIKASQAEEIVERAAIVNAAIINTLAPKYYCPELSNG